jgi:hypothetical protein
VISAFSKQAWELSQKGQNHILHKESMCSSRSLTILFNSIYAITSQWTAVLVKRLVYCTLLTEWHALCQHILKKEACTQREAVAKSSGLGSHIQWYLKDLLDFQEPLSQRHHDKLSLYFETLFGCNLFGGLLLRKAYKCNCKYLWNAHMVFKLAFLLFGTNWAPFAFLLIAQCYLKYT